jgi:hypothetical protein
MVRLRIADTAAPFPASWNFFCGSGFPAAMIDLNASPTKHQTPNTKHQTPNTKHPNTQLPKLLGKSEARNPKQYPNTSK